MMVCNELYAFPLYEHRIWMYPFGYCKLDNSYISAAIAKLEEVHNWLPPSLMAAISRQKYKNPQTQMNFSSLLTSSLVSKIHDHYRYKDTQNYRKRVRCNAVLCNGRRRLYCSFANCSHCDSSQLAFQAGRHIIAKVLPIFLALPTVSTSRALDPCRRDLPNYLSNC